MLNGFRNSLLNSFPPQLIERLQLRPFHFHAGYEIELVGTPIYHVYFLEEGLASTSTHFKDGSQMEAGIFGCESAIGLSALLGSDTSLHCITMQVAGHGFCCSTDHARAEFVRGAEFQHQALRYLQIRMLRSTYSAGCVAMHSLAERLARWLLRCADKARDEHIRMSHNELANALGSSRTTITLAAAQFKKDGLIRYTRGNILIVDRAGLEARACECYAALRTNIADLRPFHGLNAPFPPTASHINSAI